MALYLFARFHARPGCEAAVHDALLAVVAPTRGEAGCLGIHAFRSVRDRQEFYVHSRWQDQSAFDLHSRLAHTVRFIEEVTRLIDHPLAVTLAERVDDGH
jgi:quinol monooxygenase YgiN